MDIKLYVSIVSRLIIYCLSFFAPILKVNKYELFSNCFNFMLNLFTIMPAAGSYQRLMMISYLDEEILVSNFLWIRTFYHLYGMMDLEKEQKSHSCQ